MKCYILDDQYGKKIYQELSNLLPNVNFPIQENILNPLLYLDEIEAEKADYILLDNYFPSIDGTGREEALGEMLLEEYLKRGLQSKIICISDYGQRLLERYFFWEEANKKGLIVGRVSSKEGKDILTYLK